MTERPEERTVTLLIPLPDVRPAVRAQPRTAPTERTEPRTVERPRTAPRTIDVPLAPVRPEHEPYVEPDEPTIEWSRVQRPAPAPRAVVRRTRHLTVVAVTVPVVGAVGFLCALMSSLTPAMLLGGAATAAIAAAAIARLARWLGALIGGGS